MAGDASLRRLIIAYGLFGFGYIITTTFLVTIVRLTPAIRWLEPVIWIVFGLAAAPSVALWTWIARRFNIATAFALACVVEAAGVLALLPAPCRTVWGTSPYRRSPRQSRCSSQQCSCAI